MSDDIQAVIDLAATAYEPQILEPGKYYAIPNPTGGIVEIDLTGDKWADAPKRIKGTTNVTDIASLHTYWDKHADPISDMFADPTRHRFEAVIDAHAGTGGLGPDWQQHRAVCTLTLSDPMKAWQACNTKEMGQEAFGEFLDEQMAFIVAPEAADLVEMVQHFEATTTASFKSAVKMQSGQRMLQYVEQVDASMSTGAIAIPRTIEVRLPVWRNMATTVDLTALLRFRVRGDKLTLSYKLVQLADVIDGAFADVVADVVEHIGRPVLLGTPLA